MEVNGHPRFEGLPMWRAVSQKLYQLLEEFNDFLKSSFPRFMTKKFAEVFSEELSNKQLNLNDMRLFEYDQRVEMKR